MVAPVSSPFRFRFTEAAYVDDLTIGAVTRAATQRKIDFLTIAGNMADFELHPGKSMLLDIGAASEAPPASHDDMADMDVPRCKRCNLACASASGLKKHMKTCIRKNEPWLTISDPQHWTIERAFGRRAHRWYGMKYTGVPSDATLGIGHGRTHLVRELDLKGNGAKKLMNAFWLNLQNDRWLANGSPTDTVPGPNHGDPVHTSTIAELKREDHRTTEDDDACRFCGFTVTGSKQPVENQRGFAGSRACASTMFSSAHPPGSHVPLEPYHKCAHRPGNVLPGTAVTARYMDKMATLERNERVGLTLGKDAIKSTLRAKILGRMQRADGSDHEEVKLRVAIAKGKLKDLTAILTSTKVPYKDKMIIYRAVIVSTIAYGCEAWHMTREVKKTLRSFNRYAHDIIIAKTSPDKPTAASYDVEGFVQWSRLKWLGHMWRMELHSTSPRQPFRAMLTGIAMAPGPTLLDYGPHQPPSSEYINEYGADPHTVDFTLDKERTFREGTLYELIPPVDRFSELRQMFLGGKDKDFKEKWRRYTRKLIQKAYPNLF
jgi:hypothetical protein